MKLTLGLGLQVSHVGVRYLGSTGFEVGPTTGGAFSRLSFSTKDVEGNAIFAEWPSPCAGFVGRQEKQNQSALR